MDPLSTLIDQLQREVDALEKPLKERDAREDAQLATSQKRIEAARAGLEQTQLAHAQVPPQLAKVEARRAELNRRINGWRGELWRIGHGSLAVMMVPLVIAGFALWKQWLNLPAAAVVLAAQLLVFVTLYFTVPEKR